VARIPGLLALSAPVLILGLLVVVIVIEVDMFAIVAGAIKMQAGKMFVSQGQLDQLLDRQ
jgi:hypothetical protein